MSRILTCVTVFVLVMAPRLALARSARYTYIKPLKEMSCEILLRELPNYASENDVLTDLREAKFIVQTAKLESKNNGKTYRDVFAYDSPQYLPNPVAAQIIQRLNAIEDNLLNKDMDLQAFEIRGPDVKRALLAIDQSEPKLEKAYSDLPVPHSFRSALLSMMKADVTVDSHYRDLMAVLVKMVSGMDHDRVFVSSTSALFTAEFHKRLFDRQEDMTQQARLAELIREGAIPNSRFIFVDNIVYWDHRKNEPVWLFVYRASDQQPYERPPTRKISVDIGPKGPPPPPKIKKGDLIPIQIRSR